MKKLNIVEALAIIQASSLFVDMEIYETKEEAIEYSLEAYQGYLREGGYEPGDEVLDVIFEMIDNISTYKEKPLYHYPAISYFPGNKTRITKMIKEDYSLRRGEIARQGACGLYVHRLGNSRDQSWYLSPWSVPELPNASKDTYVPPRVRIDGEEWNPIHDFMDGPEVFIHMYQEIGWHVYRIPCAITGYWELIAYPTPLECVDGKVQPV